MEQTLSENTMYSALIEKNSEFEGQFFAAIKTTGIFCRPTCPARKPKRVNVEYFSSTLEALNHGYRPCKVCKPLQNKGEVPSEIQNIIETFGIALSSGDLNQLGKAISGYIANGTFYTDSGAADA